MPEILDPAHDPDVQVAGVTKPEDKKEEPSFKLTEDGNLVEVNDKKYVRAEALHEERENVKKLRGVLDSLEPVMPEFEEFLKTRQTRRAATVDRAGAGGDDDYTEDELDGLAITRGYVLEDGAPDRRRAKAELQILDRVAKRASDRSVRPIADQLSRDRTETARDRALRHREQARSQAFVDGAPVADEKYLDALYNSIPAEMAADPEVAKFLLVAAAGLESLDRRRGDNQVQPAPQRREPMFVEGSRGRAGGERNQPSDLDRIAARARGKSVDEWVKLRSRVNKTDVLEDID